MAGFVSCAWEIKESLLEVEAARTNAQRWELPGTSEAGHSQVAVRAQIPEMAGGDTLFCPCPRGACQRSVRPLQWEDVWRTACPLIQRGHTETVKSTDECMYCTRLWPKEK